MTTLRWLLVPLVLVLGSVVGYAISFLVLLIILRRFVEPSDATDYASVVASVPSGFASVYFAAATAPRRKRTTLNVLAVFCVVFFGAFAFLFAATGSAVHSAQRLALIAGAGVAVSLQRWLFPIEVNE